MPQGAPAQQLHRDEHPAVYVAHVVDGDHVGVREAGQRLGLPLESGVGLGRQIGVGAQHLEGDLAVQLRVVGRVDDPRGAGAQALEDHEAADPNRLLGPREQASLDASEHRLPVE